MQVQEKIPRGKFVYAMPLHTRRKSNVLCMFNLFSVSSEIALCSPARIDVNMFSKKNAAIIQTIVFFICVKALAMCSPQDRCISKYILFKSAKAFL